MSEKNAHTITSKNKGNAKVRIFELTNEYLINNLGTFGAYGKRSNRDKKWRTIGYFKTEDERNDAAAEWMRAADERNAKAAERAAAKRKAQSEIEITQPLIVGEILVSIWGYEQTNVDFYLIVSRTAKTVKIQKIGSEIVENTDWMQGNVIPDKDNKLGEVKTKRIQVYNGVETGVNLNSYSRATPWDGKPAHYTSYH